MAESVYKVVALVGSSDQSWEQAAAAAVKQASQSLRDIRVARVIEQDIHIEPDKTPPYTYRVKMEVSFKYEGGD